MGLKSIRLTRAENLSEEIRNKEKLPNTGLIVIESWNPTLQEKFKLIKEGGIRDYLLTLGEFADVAITEAD